MSRSAAPDVEMFAEITKIDAKTRTVFGYASTEARDRQGEIVTRDAIMKALPGYMLWKNVREMHMPSAVGTAIEAQMDAKGLWFGCHVSDDRAWKKVEDKVYKGFSIGGRVLSRDDSDKSIVTGVDITEISLVDRPANPEARFELIKRSGDHLLLQPVQYWGCGCANHQHLAKAEAQECMADQAEELAKRWETTEDDLLKFNPNHGVHGFFASSDAGHLSPLTNTKSHEQASKFAQHHADMAYEHRVQAKNSDAAMAEMHNAAAVAHERAGANFRAASKEYLTSNAITGDTYRNAGIKHGEYANRSSKALGVMKVEKVGDYDELGKRDFSDKEREHLASTGQAMPGGEYPIRNTGDLHNAIQAFGRAKDPDATKAHIKTRAKALGAESMLPEDWTKAAAADDIAKATPRHVEGGKFAGHLKSAEEAGKLAADHQAQSTKYYQLSKKHKLLAEESGKAGNPGGKLVHDALANSHGHLALKHERIANRYTKLASQHGDWAQKTIITAENDPAPLAKAKQALIDKLKKFNPNHDDKGLFASSEGGKDGPVAMQIGGGKVTGESFRDAASHGGAKIPAPGTPREIHQIARDIRRDWKNVNYGAKPYLDAMGSLSSIKDNYGHDSARSVIAYFLSNATSWRGPTAKGIKAELKSMLKKSMDDIRHSLIA